MSQTKEKFDLIVIKKQLHKAWKKISSNPKMTFVVGFMMVVILAAILVVVFVVPRSKSTETKGK